jgi:hypothetical protein
MCRVRDTLGVKINANCFWMGNRKGKCHLADLGVDGRILYKYTLMRWKGEECLNQVQDRD